MTEILIDKKIHTDSAKGLSNFAKKTALKITREKTFSIEEALAYSKKLIRKCAAEK